MSRKTTYAGLMAFGVMLLAAVVITMAFAQDQPQPQPGGQRGGMRDMMYLERTWTAVSFQLECTTEQIAQLQPVYATALQTRNDAIKVAREAQDRDGVTAAVTECKTTLTEKLPEVLTDEQWTKLDELMSQGMGMRGGGGGGGNG